MVCFPSSRQTQWDPPTWDSPGDDASLEHEAEMDLGTPTYDENPMKVRGTNLWDGQCGAGRGTEVTPRSFGVAPLATAQVDFPEVLPFVWSWPEKWE